MIFYQATASLHHDDTKLSLDQASGISLSAVLFKLLLNSFSLIVRD